MTQKIDLPLGPWSPETKQGQWCEIREKKQTGKQFTNLGAFHAEHEHCLWHNHIKETTAVLTAGNGKLHSARGSAPTYRNNSSQQLANTIYTMTRLWDPFPKSNSWHKYKEFTALWQYDVLTKGTTDLSYRTWSYEAGADLKVFFLPANSIVAKVPTLTIKGRKIINSLNSAANPASHNERPFQICPVVQQQHNVRVW